MGGAATRRTGSATARRRPGLSARAQRPRARAQAGHPVPPLRARPRGPGQGLSERLADPTPDVGRAAGAVWTLPPPSLEKRVRRGEEAEQTAGLAATGGWGGDPHPTRPWGQEPARGPGHFAEAVRLRAADCFAFLVQKVRGRIVLALEGRFS